MPNIIVGAVVDEKTRGEIHVTVIATALNQWHLSYTQPKTTSPSVFASPKPAL